jgi:hypothetical protein
LDEIGSDGWMRLNDRPLFHIQWTVFQEDAVGHRNFPQIVQEPP